MVQFIIFFFIIQLINVVLNTLRTCITASGKKFLATIITSICYGFYTIVIVYTAGDMNLWVKVIITIITNLIGVYASMTFLEKMRKDKLWEIVATIPKSFSQSIVKELDDNNISYSSIYDNKDRLVLHIYSQNQKTSMCIKKILNNYNAKYIVHEENVRL